MAFVLLGLAVASWMRFEWVLPGLVVIVPLTTGIQNLGVFQDAPVLSLFFAVLYLTWLSRRLAQKEALRARNMDELLLDGLAFFVLLSALVQFWGYPLEFIAYKLSTFSGQDKSFHALEGAFVLLQGIFLCRILLLEEAFHKNRSRLFYVFWVHVLWIVAFALGQWIWRLPEPYHSTYLYSPFDDIHSFGSYALFLFFFFLVLSTSPPCKIAHLAAASFRFGSHRFQLFLSPRLFQALNIAFLLCLLVLLAGCYSRATWLAGVLTAGAFLFSKGYRKILCFLAASFIAALLVVNSFSGAFQDLDNRSARRFFSLLDVSTYADDRNVEARLELWERVLGIAGDFPLTGTGIGTFYHQSSAYHDPEDWKRTGWHENAHNYFLQLTADLGIPALLLFLGVIGCSFQAGLSAGYDDHRKYPLMGLLWGLGAYLLTCLSGHPLLLSEQQLLFWFAISVALLHRHPPGVPRPRRRLLPWSSLLLAVVMLLVLGGYGSALHRYGHFPRFYEYGFYPSEKEDGRELRWTMKEAATELRAAGPLFGFKIEASPENSSGPEGLEVKIFFEDEPWDTVHLFDGGARALYYYLPSAPENRFVIKLHSSDTFRAPVPGMPGRRREVGVAVSPVGFLEILPLQGVGFYPSQKGDAELSPPKPAVAPDEHRWTGRRASLPLSTRKKENSSTLWVGAAHPDLGARPLTVRLFLDEALWKEILFTSARWKRIELKGNTAQNARVLTLEADRTWNPRLTGFSKDSRDLGVAVAVQ